MQDINKMAARSGKVIKSDNTVVNEADGINQDGSRNVTLTGSYVRNSADPKPQGKEGNTLYLWDTKQAFIHDGTDWREV